MAVKVLMPEVPPIFKAPLEPLVKLPVPLNAVVTVTVPVLVSTAGLVTVRVPDTVKPPAPLWVNAVAVFIVKLAIAMFVVEINAPFKVLIVTVPVKDTVPAVLVNPAPRIITALSPLSVPPFTVTKPVKVLLPAPVGMDMVPPVSEVVVST